jgi:hypothetical protein
MTFSAWSENDKVRAKLEIDYHPSSKWLRGAGYREQVAPKYGPLQPAIGLNYSNIN